MSATDADVILVGGGLANALIALRMRALRPGLRVLLLERQAVPCGQHTWSFHHTDLSAATRAWVLPLARHSWNGYEVRFPALHRQLDGAYSSLLSEDLARQVGAALGESMRVGAEVADLSPTQVTLSDGRQLRAGAVIDGRGARPSPHLALGYQAFVGHTLRTETPHGLRAPTLMDASVAQGQGYRFVYVLPFSPDTLLIEDTHYTSSPQVAVEQATANIAAYAQARGLKVAERLGCERGVLPIVLDGDFQRFWPAHDPQPRAGLAAALFHPTTGYSLPYAAGLAERLAGSDQLDAATVARITREQALTSWRRQGFFRLLNRLFFMAGQPQQRWRVMQRFYGLPQGLIQRFYADRLTLADKLRILSGKPPIPLAEALRAALASPAHPRNTR